MTASNDHPGVDLAALLLRVGLGVMFIAHGFLKLTVFTLTGTAQFFAQVGFPSWMAYPVTFGEIIGGALLILGFHSRYIAAATIPILLGAVFVHWGNGWLFTATNGGWEYPAFLTLAATTVALLDDGKYSVRKLIAAKTVPANAEDSAR